MRPPPFLRLIDGLAMICALVAGVAVALLAVLILIDILGRSLVGISVQGTDELGGYVLAMCGSLGLSWTLAKRGHPRIDLGFRFFSPALRNVLHVLAYAAISAMALFMAWHAWSELEVTIRFGAVANTPLQTPLWLPQGMWVVGLCLFALTALASTAHGIWLLINEPAAVPLLYGPPSVEDEVGEYIHDAPGEN